MWPHALQSMSRSGPGSPGRGMPRGGSTTSVLKGIRAFIFDFDGTLAIPNIDFGLMRQQVDTIAKRYGVDPAQLSHLYILEMIETVSAQLVQTSAPGADDFHREAHASILALEIDCACRGSLLPGAME